MPKDGAMPELDINKAVELFQLNLTPSRIDMISVPMKNTVIDWKICQRCCTAVPKGHKFCSTSCEQLFKQRK